MEVSGRRRSRRLDASESFGIDSKNDEIVRMRKNGQFCDAVLVTKADDGRTQMELPVHRVILAANSDYFSSLFSWPSASTSSVNVYAIDGIQSEVLTVIVDYLYTGELGPWLTRPEFMELLLPAVDFLRVNGIIRKCSDRLIEEINVKNVCRIYRMATQYYFPELKEACRGFLLRHLPEVSCACPDFKDLDGDTMSELLDDDRLIVANESDAFEALVRWIDHDPDNRRIGPFAMILSKIRYGLMDVNYLKDRVLNHRYVKDPRTVPIDVAWMASTESPPRLPSGILFAVGGWTSGNPTTFLETYNCRSRHWTASLYADSLPRAYHGTASLDGRIYVVGGFDGRQHFSTCRCFDPTTRIWEERSCMHFPRCYVSVCVLERKIYALGGFDGRNRISSAERYDTSENQWTQIQNMNRPRSDASAAALLGRIYIVGGFTGEEVLNTVEWYEPETDSWTFASPMQVPRSGVSAVTHGSCLLVAGGFNGFFRLASCERYNPTYNQWTYLAYMHTPRSNFACCVLENRMYAIGGFDGDSTTFLVEEYDPEANTWIEAPPMLLDRSALSACIIEHVPVEDSTTTATTTTTAVAS